MRLLIIMLVVLLLMGCSSGNGVSPEIGENSDLPEFDLKLPQANRLSWSNSLFRVSTDHTTIERLPNRSGDYHFNVNGFVEPPNCSYCLQIFNPQLQEDGTIKVKVTLTHPFPNSPEYTGFDVRGTVMFPATRYWQWHAAKMWDIYGNPAYELYTPLFFSRHEDGGAELLNADGWTIYLNPGLDLVPHLPITKYSKGKQAYGPDPDSTINGYRLFTKDYVNRRMFRVNDTISRIYHIDPPEGEFIFGYVVDASWAEPTTKPVTDPEKDFPFWANAEDGYVLESKQLAPIHNVTYGPYYPPLEYQSDREVAEVTILGSSIQFRDPFESNYYDSEVWLFDPDLTEDWYLDTHGIAKTSAWGDNDLGDGILQTVLWMEHGTYNAEPGTYIGLIAVRISYYDKGDDSYPIQVKNPVMFDFIELEVVEGGW